MSAPSAESLLGLLVELDRIRTLALELLERSTPQLLPVPGTEEGGARSAYELLAGARRAVIGNPVAARGFCDRPGKRRAPVRATGVAGAMDRRRLTRPARGTMRRKLFIFALAAICLVFVSGVAVGVVGRRAFQPIKFRSVLVEELDLTPDQRYKLQRIWSKVAESRTPVPMEELGKVDAERWQRYLRQSFPCHRFAGPPTPWGSSWLLTIGPTRLGARNRFRFDVTQEPPEGVASTDQSLRALGTAVIAGPSDHAGQLPDVGVADMSPPRRRPCARLASRVVVRCDGTVVACEQDFAGRAILGNIADAPMTEIWQNRLAPLRSDHRAGNLAAHALCGSCRDWNRP